MRALKSGPVSAVVTVEPTSSSPSMNTGRRRRRATATPAVVITRKASGPPAGSGK